MALALRAACLLAVAAAAPCLSQLSTPATLDVPLVRQQKEGCGAAALAMVVEYWRAARPELALEQPDANAIYRSLYSARDKGISATSLIREFERRGFHALPMAASRDDLREQLAGGRPLIAVWKEGRLRHYVVVRGIETDAVWVNDPWDGKAHLISWREFDKRWEGAARWALLAVPRSSR